MFRISDFYMKALHQTNWRMMMNTFKQLPIAIAMITGLGFSGQSLAADLQSESSVAIDTQSVNADGSAAGAISNQSETDRKSSAELKDEASTKEAHAIVAEAKRKADAREKAYQAWRSRKSDEAEALFNGSANGSLDAEADIDASEEAEAE
jgi:hypothetical protein